MNSRVASCGDSAVGAEDLRGGRFRFAGGALVHQQIAELDHRVVEVGAEYGLAQVLVEHVPDGTLAVEHAAVMAGAGPHLVAGLGELDDAPEERGLELLDVLLEVAVDVLGHEVRRVLLRIDQAAHDADQQPLVMLLKIVGGHHEEHRDVQADVLERLHDPLPVDAVAVLACGLQFARQPPAPGDLPDRCRRAGVSPAGGVGLRLARPDGGGGAAPTAGTRARNVR